MMLSTLKQNVIANLLGRGWSALMALVFVPFYLQFLGIEGYALVGFSLTLFSLASILDLGIGTTLNRELARRSSDPDQAHTVRDLVLTLEVFCWFLALIIGLAILGSASAVANYWVKPKALTSEEVTNAIRLIGIALAFQWPMSLYTGGLLGLERQITLNALTAFTATVRGVGAVLVLWGISPTVEAFFVWQAAVSVAQTAWCAIALRRSLPASAAPARFRPSLVGDIGGFAAGVSAISMISVALSHLDKVILSALLPLEIFGYYTLAGVLATAAMIAVAPIFAAVFPRFSRVVETAGASDLVHLYHAASQLVSVAMLPLSGTIVLFSSSVLLLWTQDASIAHNAAPLAAVITVGAALNAAINIPYALQLAYGWTRLFLAINIGNLVLLGPLLYLAVGRYGALGAAAVTALMSTWNFVLVSGLFHRRVLRGERWRWLWADLAVPAAGVVSVGFLSKILIPPDAPPLVMATLILLVTMTATAVAIVLTPIVRGYAVQAIARIRIA